MPTLSRFSVQQSSWCQNLCSRAKTFTILRIWKVRVFTGLECDSFSRSVVKTFQIHLQFCRLYSPICSQCTLSLIELRNKQSNGKISILPPLLKIIVPFYPLQLMMWHGNFAQTILFIKMDFCKSFTSLPVILQVLHQIKFRDFGSCLR